MTRIFISYSSKNNLLIEHLARLLTDIGYEVWYDQQLYTGEWWPQIMRAVRTCDIFLYALTPEYLDSYPCDLEYNYAVALERKICPTRLTAIDFGRVPSHIALNQVIDLSALDTDNQHQSLPTKFIRALHDLENQPQIPPDSRVPEPPPPISTLNYAIEQIAQWNKPLSAEDQSRLMADIRPLFYRAESRANARYVLERYRRRTEHDNGMLTHITDEIDSLLALIPADVTPPIPVPVPVANPQIATRIRRSPLLIGLLVSMILTIGGAIAFNGRNNNGIVLTSIGSNTTPTNLVAVVISPSVSPTATPIPPTATPLPLTATLIPLTATPISPTATPIPPTATPILLTATPILLTATPIPTVTINNQWTPQIKSFNGVNMVLVPQGCFKMGGGYFSNEDPSTQVCVSLSFWIDQTPVSEAQFKQFNGQAAQKPNFNGNNFPVDTISWVEAKNFCELNRGGRLPTEIEWEYAARGPSNLIYSWGNRFDSSKLIYLYNANGRIGEVNRDMTNLAASSWVGAIDMTGNIWQWVSSIYGSYPYNPSLAENNNDIKSNRVVRGGAWNSSQLYVGTTVRFNYPPKFSGDNVGFRCAHSV